MEENDKSLANWSKTLRKIFKITGIITLVIVISIIINTLTTNGLKSFYCFSNKQCITIWKRDGGEVYVILGKYDSRKVPSDNYIKMTNVMFSYISVLRKQDNKLLFSISDNATVITQSTNSQIELYNDNKILNDSLYTYYDGQYQRYKKEVNFISINIEENYATDKNGNKLK